MSIVGTAGNSFVLYVYWHKRDHRTCTMVILVLACTDLITCTTLIPLAAYLESVQCRILLDVLCKSYHFLNATNIPFSVFLMVLIAVERYFKICHPWKRILVPCSVKIVVCVLAFLSAACGVLVALMHGVYQNGFYYKFENMNATNEVEAHRINITLIGSWFVNCQQESNVGEQLKIECEKLSEIYEKFLKNKQSFVSVKKYPGVKYGGDCGTNEIILSNEFRDAFQLFLYVVYGCCLFLVAIFYILVYKEILHLRRRQRNRERRAKYFRVSKSFRSERSFQRRVKNWSQKRKTIKNKELKNKELKESDLTSSHLKSSGENEFIKEEINRKQSIRKCISFDDVHYFSKPTLKKSSNKYFKSPQNFQNSMNNEKQFKAHGNFVSSLKRNYPQLDQIDGCSTGKTGSKFVQKSNYKLRNSQSQKNPEISSANKLPEKIHKVRQNNLKTAAILFTVTLVFFASFIPSILMSLDLFRHVRIIHYFYLTNHVANPFIYSFMNHNFRGYVTNIFKDFNFKKIN